MKFKKGQKVAKIISVGGFKTITFGHIVTSVGIKGIRVKVLNSDHPYLFALTGRGCDLDFIGLSTIVPEEEGVRMAKAGEVDLDGGETIPGVNKSGKAKTQENRNKKGSKGANRKQLARSGSARTT